MSSGCFSPPGPTWSRLDEASQRLPFRTICWYSRWSTWGPLLPEANWRKGGPRCRDSHCALDIWFQDSGDASEGISQGCNQTDKSRVGRIRDGRVQIVCVNFSFFSFALPLVNGWLRVKMWIKTTAAIWCPGHCKQPCRNSIFTIIRNNTCLYFNLAGSDTESFTFTFISTFAHIASLHSFVPVPCRSILEQRKRKHVPLPPDRKHNFGQDLTVQQMNSQGQNSQDAMQHLSMFFRPCQILTMILHTKQLRQIPEAKSFFDPNRNFVVRTLTTTAEQILLNGSL